MKLIYVKRTNLYKEAEETYKRKKVNLLNTKDFYKTQQGFTEVTTNKDHTRKNTSRR